MNWLDKMLIKIFLKTDELIKNFNFFSYTQARPEEWERGKILRTRPWGPSMKFKRV